MGWCPNTGTVVVAVAAACTAKPAPTTSAAAVSFGHDARFLAPAVAHLGPAGVVVDGPRGDVWATTAGEARWCAPRDLERIAVADDGATLWVLTRTTSTGRYVVHRVGRDVELNSTDLDRVLGSPLPMGRTQMVVSDAGGLPRLTLAVDPETAASCVDPTVATCDIDGASGVWTCQAFPAPALTSAPGGPACSLRLVDGTPAAHACVCQQGSDGIAIGASDADGWSIPPEAITTIPPDRDLSWRATRDPAGVRVSIVAAWAERVGSTYHRRHGMTVVDVGPQGATLTCSPPDTATATSRVWDGSCETPRTEAVVVSPEILLAPSARERSLSPLSDALDGAMACIRIDAVTAP